MKVTRNYKKDVRLTILLLLHERQYMTTRQILDNLYSQIPLSNGDVSRANKRPNEYKIDQIGANALQRERFLCANRLIRRVGRGVFEITKRGRIVVAECKKRSEA